MLWLNALSLIICFIALVEVVRKVILNVRAEKRFIQSIKNNEDTLHQIQQTLSNLNYSTPQQLKEQEFEYLKAIIESNSTQLTPYDKAVIEDSLNQPSKTSRKLYLSKIIKRLDLIPHKPATA